MRGVCVQNRPLAHHSLKATPKGIEIHTLILNLPTAPHPQPPIEKQKHLGPVSGCLASLRKRDDPRPLLQSLVTLWPPLPHNEEAEEESSGGEPLWVGEKDWRYVCLSSCFMFVCACSC